MDSEFITMARRDLQEMVAMQQAIFFSDAGLNRAAEMRQDKINLADAFLSSEALV